MRRQAEEKYREYHKHAIVEGALAHFSSSTGLDFSRYEQDEPISISLLGKGTHARRFGKHGAAGPIRPTPRRGAGPFEMLKTQDSWATPGRSARLSQSTNPTSQ